MDASACSCLPLNPWEAYERSAAAVIGVYEGKRGPTTYRFTVEQAYKADLPRELEVESAEHGATCGLEAHPGQRLGLFLSREGDGWRSNLCSQARPEQIRIAASLPRPNGRGAVRFLVGGGFGPATVQSLDADGRTLAYGAGDRPAIALSICPGERTMVDVSAPAVLTVRELASLRVLRRIELRLRDHEFPANVACADAHGRTIFLFAWRANTGRLLRVRGGAVSQLYHGPGIAATFVRRHVYIAGARRGIVRVDLATARRRLVAGPRFDTAPAVSPDGRRLVSITNRGRIAVVDIRRRRTSLGPSVGSVTHAVWIDSQRIAWIAEGEVIVRDIGFRPLARFTGWRSTHAVADGRRLVGIQADTLRMARLPRGPARTVRRLVSPETSALVLVPRGPRVRLAASVSCVGG